MELHGVGTIVFFFHQARVHMHVIVIRKRSDARMGQDSRVKGKVATEINQCIR